jgi:pimeloyl-ACP methyl ester carboxylesterase
MRACQPSRDGYVERDGVKVHYEVYGDGEPTVLLLPTWSIIHSRHWKMQIPYLARHCRVLTFDGRGNGRSDRPTEPEAYRSAEFTADALAVMDASGTERAVLVSRRLGIGGECSTECSGNEVRRWVSEVVDVGGWIGEMTDYIGGGVSMTTERGC